MVRSIALLTCLAAAAQTPVYHPGPDVTAPLVVAKIQPAYTEEARLAKLEGSVFVVAGGAGRWLAARYSSGSRDRPGFGRRGRRKLRAWQFKPGMRSGRPVPVQVNVEVFFRPQRSLWDWHVMRAAFRASAGTTRPALIKVKFPPTVDLEENASVTVAFDVSPKGVPVNVVAVEIIRCQVGERIAGRCARRLAVSTRNHRWQTVQCARVVRVRPRIALADSARARPEGVYRALSLRRRAEPAPRQSGRSKSVIVRSAQRA